MKIRVIERIKVDSTGIPKAVLRTYTAAPREVDIDGEQVKWTCDNCKKPIGEFTDGGLPKHRC